MVASSHMDQEGIAERAQPRLFDGLTDQRRAGSNPHFEQAFSQAIL